MSVVISVPPHEVVLMDADRLFRESLAGILRFEKFDVIQLAGSPSELSLERLAESDHPILVADVEQDEEKVLELFREAKKLQPKLKIMVVTRSTSPSTMDACIELGVDAYVSKNISSKSFRNYLMFVALDEKVVHFELANSLRSRGTGSHSSTLPSVGIAIDFSPREHAILGYLVQGDSNKSIARRLDIADGTVKVGVKSILRKIKATNRTQAAIWALQHGFTGEQAAADSISLRDKSIAPLHRRGSNGHHRRENKRIAGEHLPQFENDAKWQERANR